MQDDIVNEIGAKSGISFEIENGEMINSEERNAIIEREIVVKSSHDLDLKSELNALRAFVVQFRASRYIMRLNQTSV